MHDEEHLITVDQASHVVAIPTWLASYFLAVTALRLPRCLVRSEDIYIVGLSVPVSNLVLRIFHYY